MVGISYNKGDVFCGHFEGAINGGKMEHIVQEAEKASLKPSKTLLHHERNVF